MQCLQIDYKLEKHRACAQGLPGNLPEAAEAARRRRKRGLLVKDEEESYTPGTSFNMGAIQQSSDRVSSCTPSVRCDASLDRINDAVVAIYAINVKLGAMAMCTGDFIIPFTFLAPCRATGFAGECQVQGF